MNTRKRGLTFFLTAVILLTGVFSGLRPMEVKAATKYITIEDFIVEVVDQIGISVDKSSEHPYIEAAKQSGIIKENEFTNLNKNTTRTDAAIILVRADEYLHGETVNQDMVDLVIDKRISDISSISKDKRESVAKCYALGFIKGYSNGAYSTDREFRGNKKLTAKGAKQVIQLLTKKSKRAKISPDGQLIRTTKLPSNADMYPYILASYPNAYYDWEFEFMKWYSWNGTPLYGTDEWVSMKDYVAPVDIEKFQIDIWDNQPTKELLNSFIDIWTTKATKYIQTAFSIDYKTIENDTNWYNTMLELDHNYGWRNQPIVEERLNKYIDAVKENKTVIECSKVAVDRSTLYYDAGYFYLRAYVKYRINSAKDTSQVRLSPLAYTNLEYAYYNNVTLGEWRNGYFDISFDGNGNGEHDFILEGISELVIDDEAFLTRVVK